MRSTAIDRRTALGGLAASALLPAGASATSRAPAYIAAAKDGNGYAAVLLDRDGRPLARAALPGRGHGAAVARASATAVLFARRPGAFAVPIDLATSRAAAPFRPPRGRRFSGHGCFSPDGRFLYAAENDFEDARGVVGVYDALSDWKRIGEFPSHGVGPHEIRMLSDGRTIAVANGGIATHPDLPRMKLNLAEMRPNLAYIDRMTGDCVEVAEAPRAYRRLSIRHIAETTPGEVWWGGQYEGAAADLPPLIGVHRRGAPMTLPEAAADPGMRNYIGSLARNLGGDKVAATSPRGGRVQIWDTRRRRLLETRHIADACGVAPSGSGFLVSDGLGRLRFSTGRPLRAAGLAWDNHLAAI